MAIPIPSRSMKEIMYGFLFPKGAQYDF